MATAEVRRLKLAFPEAQVVVLPPEGETAWSAQQAIVFKNNPRLTAPDRVREFLPVVRVLNRPGQRPYIERMDEQRVHFTQYRAEPGEIYFDDRELHRIEALRTRLGSFRLLDPTVKRKMIRHNKDWEFGGRFPDRWRRLAEECSAHGLLVQVGQFGRMEPSAVLDLPHLHTPGFRDALCVLAASDGVICHEGGMHHAAAALGKPAVVIFGGRTPPDRLGYRNHANLYVDGPDSPCGAIPDCEHCRRCMEAITVERVAAAARSTFGW
ncbi:MAG TPA: hypothetical protein VJP77_00615 [Planctomycetota bacterium]|nr:hypothetical protein [Planctomycetota bacterium]